MSRGITLCSLAMEDRMEIKIQFGKRIFSLLIGRNTLWFAQVSLISITEEYWNDKREIEYANLVFRMF